MVDFAVIGAGIVGSAIAWELSKYEADVVVLEKENDIALGATRANSGIIHAGYDPEPGTLAARYNVPGARMIPEIAADLDVHFRQTGSLVLAFSDRETQGLHALLARGQKNGVPGLQILSSEATRALEPRLSERVTASLYAPTAGIVNPWELALAFMETAIKNGVRLLLDAAVTGIGKEKDHYRLRTADGREVSTRFVINAAGAYADEVSALAAGKLFSITPTKGEYFLFDKSAGETVDRVIFCVPDELGKGVIIAPTVHGNLIVGPDAEPVADKDDTATDGARLAYVRSRALQVIPSLPFNDNIRNFAGLRAAADTDDFVIGFQAPGFFNVAGIKSPGLTAAPAIADDIPRRFAAAGYPLNRKAYWQGKRRIVRIRELPAEEKAAAIRANPAYGHIICRCETISEGEILDACRRGMKPVSLDGIKRRTGAGMGRCQGGFCGAGIVAILAGETGIDPLRICQDKAGSRLFAGRTKSAGGTDD